MASAKYDVVSAVVTTQLLGLSLRSGVRKGLPMAFCLAAAAICMASPLVTAGAAEVDFQRDVQPILSEHCAQCHGVDAAARQSGLRLDLRDDALRGGESGSPAIVPGEPSQSELVRRILATDPDECMPPPDHGKPLTDAQRQLLVEWVRNGASYAVHWAFQRPTKPTLSGAPGEHPIDALVRSRRASMDLESKGLIPAPKADAAVLCRRLYLDLIGLPPTPSDVDRYRNEGHVATIERLLQSERFGEKWARHWLDVARYSDTNGYEKDLPRNQWAWRDWVVQALNRDLPYDQFIIEQIAGDLLPGADQEQRIATGFLRNSMLNEEGAIVAEQFRMVEMFDRIDCLGKGVLGLTIQCAQCHSHKFDPITQDDYYGVFACLNNCYEAHSPVYAPEQLTTIADLFQKMRAREDALRSERPAWRDELSAWESALMAAAPTWEPLKAVELDSNGGGNHPVQHADLAITTLGATTSEFFLVADPTTERVTGIRVETLLHSDLPRRGPGRAADGTFTLSEIEAFVRKSAAEPWSPLKLKHATADFSQPERTEGENGKDRSGPVSLLIDGDKATSWTTDRGEGRRNQPGVAVVQLAEPITLEPGAQLKFTLWMGRGGMLGCCRVSVTSDADPATPPVPYAAQLAMKLPEDQRSDDDRSTIFAAWRSGRPEFSAANEEIEAIWAQYPAPSTSVLHLAEREPARRRTTHRLDRGEWDRPLEEAAPRVPTALHPPRQPLNSEDGPARLRLAQWLVDPQSPLAARVAVNRVWQTLFGAGLVVTSDDFGTRAPAPEHQGLLDWLAVDLMERGWSVKQLIHTITTSETYQQSSHASPAALEIDPQNRWLARGPRFRADAEVVRDIALSVSGLLNSRIGGAPTIPPVPQNVLDYNYSYPTYWIPTEGVDRYRRSLYLFRKRSMPDPALSTFDSPNGDAACARRVRSNTPLAALASLNEPVFVEAARALGLRILREGGSDDAQRARFAFRVCLARDPSPGECEALTAFVDSRRTRLAQGWLNARALTTGDPDQLPELPVGATPQDAGAWTLAARVLLNLDETISKN